MVEPSQLDLDHLRQWIGRSEQASDVVTPRLVKGLLATIGEDALGLTDEMEAPLAVHWCLAPPIVPMAQLGPDGHPSRGGFLPPVPLPRRMWAGGRLEFYNRLRVADTVTRRSTILNVSVKQGRTGALCFVTVGHEISTERGLAIRERQDVVYRGAGPSDRFSPPQLRCHARPTIPRLRGSGAVRCLRTRFCCSAILP